MSQKQQAKPQQADQLTAAPEFEARKVFGRWLYYPLNEYARQLCKFADSRRGNTINAKHMAALKQTGIKPVIRQEVPK